MCFQDDGQVIDFLFFPEGRCNLIELLFSYAFYFQKAFGLLFHNFHSIRAKCLDDTMRQRRTDALDSTGGEEAFDPFGRIGQEPFPRSGTKLLSVPFMLYPVPLYFQPVPYQRLRSIAGYSL